MKKQEFVQVKGLDLKELKLKVKALREEIAGLILDKNMKKLKDLKMISKKKKDLAQVLTMLRQKELLQELELRVQKDSENSSERPRNLREPDSQNTRESDNPEFRSSDLSGTPSSSEFSENTKRHAKRRAKK